MNELVALIDGHEVGRVTHSRRDRLSFCYDPAWREAERTYPLSLSMPIAASEHGHDAVHAFLWGLLPDNDRILDAWGRRFGISPRNPFALLAHVGEDCAGAVQFVTPERLEPIRSGSLDGVQWLAPREVADRLRALRTDQAAWRRLGESQFSLAGAQPKTALIEQGGQWGIPSGRTPTTHILKPPTSANDGLAENEHVCLELAAALGLPAARSRVLQFEDQVAIVVQRYDRLQTGGHVRRIHQEDVCQALGLPPTRKYQNEGGPGAGQIVTLLRDHSNRAAEDVATFLSSLAFNWIIGGPDGHARNYSVLIAAEGVRLAPLYDIASALPYPDLDPPRIRLAMRVGGEYLMKKIGTPEWAKLAAETRVRADELLEGITALAVRVPDALRHVCHTAAVNGLSHPILERLEREIGDRALHCATGPT